MVDVKPKLKDYKHALYEIMASVIGVSIAKFVIAIIPVFVYLIFRQVYMSCYYLLSNRDKLKDVSIEFKSMNKSTARHIFLLGLFRSTNIVLAYYVFSLINMSVFVSLENPICVFISLLIAILFLHERPSAFFYLGMLVIIIGTAFITGVETSGLTPLMIIALVINGLALAVSGMVVQKVSPFVSAELIKIVFIGSPIPVVFVCALIQISSVGFSWVYDVTFFVLLLAAISSNMTLISNAKGVDAQAAIGVVRFQVIKSAAIVLSVLIGFVFLDETLVFNQIIGISLNIVGVIVIILSKNNKAVKKSAST